MAAQVGEVFGDLHLLRAQHLLEVTDAERPVQQQVEQPQTRAVAQALVDRDQVHGRLAAAGAAGAGGRKPAGLLREAVGVLVLQP